MKTNYLGRVGKYKFDTFRNFSVSSYELKKLLVTRNY